MEDVDRLSGRRRLVATIGCAAALLALAGCTTASFEIPRPSVTASSGPPALPTEFLAYEPVEGERAVGTLATQTGINSLGPFTVASERVAVYVDCLGQGTVSVEISGVARFDNPCYPRVGPLGTRNELDMRYVDDYTVTVTATDEQLWALTITEPDS